MSDPEIEIEVEDPAWNAVADVEGVVTRAAMATLQFLPLWGRGTAREYARGGGGSAGPSEEPINTGADRAQSEPSSAGAAPTTTAFGGGPPPPEGEELTVVVLLTSDEAVAELNQQFRHKAGPTNVLSFPAPENPENLLGDIALAYGVCAREAAEQGKALGDHLSHLTVHGVLHLAGYDHQTDDEAQVMEDLERRVLAALGVSDPYAADRD